MQSFIDFDTTCEKCRGSGLLREEICPSCSGYGRRLRAPEPAQKVNQRRPRRHGMRCGCSGCRAVEEADRRIRSYSGAKLRRIDEEYDSDKTFQEEPAKELPHGRREWEQLMLATGARRRRVTK